MRFVTAAVFAALATTTLHASLVLVGPAPEGGAGLGNRQTVLTLQSPANSTIETGCVGPSETTTGCGFADSDVQTGAGQIGSFTVGDLGLASFADLRIIFNASEPGNSTGITLNQLALTLYNTTTSSTATFTLAAPVFLDATFLGVGQEGYMFQLDDAQAGQANAFAGSNTSIVLGLGASVGCEGQACMGPATGGLDTFSLANAGSGVGSEIPEPSTWMLLLSGGLLVGMNKFRAAK